jgi:hypothetical protein
VDFRRSKQVALAHAVLDDVEAYQRHELCDQEALNRALGVFIAEGRIGGGGADSHSAGVARIRMLPKDEFYNPCFELGGSALVGWRPTSIPPGCRIIHACCVRVPDKAGVLEAYKCLSH